MKSLSHPDLTRLTTSTQSFLFLTAFIAVWGEVVALAYFVFNLELSWLALAIMLEAVVWSGSTILQAQVRSNRGENLILIGTAVIVTSVTLVSMVLLETSPEIAFILLFISVQFAAQTYRQHALAYIGPVYAARHRRNALVNRIVVGRGLAGLAVLGVILFTGENVIAIMLVLWLVAIGLHLGMGLWLEQAAEDFETQSPEGSAYAETIGRQLTLSRLALIWENQLTRWLSLSVLCVAFLSNILLFQAAVIVGDQFVDLADIVAFYAVSAAVGLWVTLPISYRLLAVALRRYNAGQLVWLYPTLLAVGLLADFLLPLVLFAALSEVIRRHLRFTLHDPLHRLLHRALPESEQAWAGRLWQGVIDPLGRFVAGAVLLATIDFAAGLAVAGLVVAFAFILAALRAGQLYSSTLQDSLMSNNYRLLRQTTDDLTISDQVFVKGLIQRVQAGIENDRELLHVVEVIAESELEAAYDALTTLWYKSDPHLQAELLSYIVDAWPDKTSAQANAALIRQALESDHPPLRQQALTMIARYPQLNPDASLARFLIDPDPKVDVVAAWILLRNPSVHVRHAARAQLRWLARDNNASIRVTAVTALVHGSLNSFGEVVHPVNIEPYMNDPATRVREAALPAATIPQLVTAACDPSADVRKVAVQQLHEHRFQGSVRQLVARIEEQETLVVSTNYLQIEASLNYWRLLSAIRQLSWRTSRARLFEDLREGFEQIDVLNNTIIALTCLDEQAFNAVIRQIERDRKDLLNTMIWNLGTLIGQSQVESLMWVLRTGEGTADYTTTHAILSQHTTPLLATKFAEALRLNIDAETALQSPLPVIAFEVLLVQRDEWRPLLTLFALSQLPRQQRENWVNANDVERVIVRSLNSPAGVIREGGRLVKRLLVENESGPPQYGLKNHLQKDEEERLLMLSTLERMLFLRNVSFFENLRLDQLRSLARGCRELTAPEGEVIIEQGTIGNSLFIVVEGQVRVEVAASSTTRKTVLSKLGPGDVFGEMSLLDGRIRSASVVAETPVLLLSIHREALNTALEDDPNIAMVMLQALAKRLRNNNELLSKQPQPYGDD